jgi:hypothetical protein
MAIVHSTSKAGLGVNRPKAKVRRRKKSASRVSSAPARNSDGQSQPGTRRAICIAAPLRAFLESERDALIKAQSLLVCITTAMESEHGATGPYYPDVIGIAADSLRRRVVNLDELLLAGVVPEETIDLINRQPS